MKRMQITTMAEIEVDDSVTVKNVEKFFRQCWWSKGNFEYTDDGATITFKESRFSVNVLKAPKMTKRYAKQLKAYKRGG